MSEPGAADTAAGAEGEAEDFPSGTAMGQRGVGNRAAWFKNDRL